MTHNIQGGEGGDLLCWEVLRGGSATGWTPLLPLMPLGGLRSPWAPKAPDAPRGTKGARRKICPFCTPAVSFNRTLTIMPTPTLSLVLPYRYPSP